jgi:hypothetical protein
LTVITFGRRVKMPELRKCIVGGKAAYFHRWAEVSEIVPPSPMVGGHNGGVLRRTFGIIEYQEDGVVKECYPSEIRFLNVPPEEEKETITIGYGDGRVEKIRKGEL